MYNRAMNSMSSADFRKSYATLTEDTIVTVNGHIIGIWSPIAGDTMKTIALKEATRQVHEQYPDAVVEYDVKPFTPVPKPSAKRR